MEMLAVLAYCLFLGMAIGAALGLYYALKTAKLF